MSATCAGIKAIAYHLPAQRLSNADLRKANPDWASDKIESKTGIAERRIAAPQETASDLAIAAARKLFNVSGIVPSQIDFIVFCTQSPDYLLPSSACLIQSALEVPITSGAIDINMGCSGFVYGLGLCKALIESGQADRIVLLTSDTYSKLIHPNDRSVRTIFGDAAAAALVERRPMAAGGPALGPFRYGTDGRGAGDLIVPASGMRARTTGPVVRGGPYGPEWLYMNGPAIFSFTLAAIPKLVDQLLRASECTLDEIDMIIPHQANAYMLEALRKRLKVPQDKFFVDVRDIGNTVSATIPIALVSAVSKGLLKANHRVMLLGFGVGLSWAGTMMQWNDIAVGVSDASVDSPA